MSFPCVVVVRMGKSSYWELSFGERRIDGVFPLAGKDGREIGTQLFEQSSFAKDSLANARQRRHKTYPHLEIVKSMFVDYSIPACINTYP
jgi:hypothetical protein